MEVSWVKQVMQVIWVILGNGSEPDNAGNGGKVVMQVMQVMQVIWVLLGNGSEPGNAGNGGKLGKAGNASNLGNTR